MDIKIGMIGFSGGDLFIQKAIRFFIGSDFSHSFMVGEREDGVLCALETSSTKVMFGPVSDKLNEKNWVEMWEVIGPTDEVKKAVTDDCRKKYFAKWYAYLSYVWFMYRWGCRKFGYEPTKMWGWCTWGETCTELTSEYPSDNRIFPDLFKGMDINTISPDILHAMMVKNPDKFVCLGWYVPKQ